MKKLFETQTPTATVKYLIKHYIVIRFLAAPFEYFKDGAYSRRLTRSSLSFNSISQRAQRSSYYVKRVGSRTGILSLNEKSITLTTLQTSKNYHHANTFFCEQIFEVSKYLFWFTTLVPRGATS